MTGFGPFEPVVIFREGWYFDPLRLAITVRSRRSIPRGSSIPRFGAQPPVVVQPRGWYFSPIRVTRAPSYETARRFSTAPGLEQTKAVIPTNTVAPVASGTPQDGQTLSTTVGTWTGTTPRTDGSGYQWQTATDLAFTTSVLDIGGATASTYLLTAAEIGLYVRCVVASINVAAIGLGYSNVLGPVTA